MADEKQPAPTEQLAAPLYTPVRATEFASATLTPPHWAVANIWPEGAMGVIGGAPKNGKSSLALELAITLATGTPFLGLADQFPMRVPPSPVLYVQVENSKGRVQRDLQEVLVARGLGYFEQESVGYVDLAYPGEEEKLGEEQFVRRFEPTSDAHANLHVLSNVPMVVEHDDVREWISEYVKVHGIRYLFLDPLYMLTAIEYESKSGAIRPLFGFLTGLKSDLNCATIVTHHQTSKHTSGSAASRLLGDTYIFGWYESALFTSRTGNLFTLEVDAMRELGIEDEFTLTGEGIGNWSFDEYTQGLTDTLGRKATRTSQKEANVSKLGVLESEHPDWNDDEFAKALGVKTTKTVRNYRDDLQARVTDA